MYIVNAKLGPSQDNGQSCSWEGVARDVWCRMPLGMSPLGMSSLGGFPFPTELRCWVVRVSVV